MNNFGRIALSSKCCDFDKPLGVTIEQQIQYKTEGKPKVKVNLEINVKKRSSFQDTGHTYYFLNIN